MPGISGLTVRAEVTVGELRARPHLVEHPFDHDSRFGQKLLMAQSLDLRADGGRRIPHMNNPDLG